MLPSGMRETIAIAAGAALLGMGAASARAQVAEPRKSVDVSGFAGVAGYGRDIELGNSWAAEQIPGTGVVLGGRVGLTLLPDLAPASALDPQLGVEGELGLAFSSTGESMDGGRRSFFSPVFGWRIHGIARLRTTGKVHPHLVVGVGGETVWTGSPFMADDTDAAFHWGLGLTWNASPSWIARLDLRHGVTAGRTSYLVNTFELQLGIEKSFGFGGGHETVAKRPDPEPDPEPKPIPDPDLDKDGIVNEQDQCPTDPEDADGFEDDNGCPDPDNDQDQILDAVDQCPVEAEDVDQFEDEDGCPELDNDGDSIPDDMDPCPLEPENVNGFEDSNGCPDVLPDIVKKYTGVISGITFAYSRAGIKKSSKKVLNKAAAVLREYPDLRIRIEGHTDPKGKRDKNVSLSLRRAETVKWYLVDQGIEASRIETVGWGPDHPMASNKTAKGRAKNRRIEFHLIVTEPPAAPEPAPAPEPTPPTEPGL
jgi:OOP family OmpA-OmpF porin